MASEGIVSSIIEGDLVPLVVLDRDGNIRHANPGAEKSLRLERSRIEGRRYDDPAWAIEDLDGGVFPGEALPFARVMRERRPVRDVRHAIRWPDGTRRVLSISADPVFGEDGAFMRVLASFRDITDHVETADSLRRARLQAEEASAARERFLAVISHEMRTPLHAVLGSLDILEQDGIGPAYRPHLRQAQASGRALLAIIEDVLDVSRLCAGRVEIKPAPLDLDEFVAGLARLTRGLRPSPSLAILFDVAPDAPRCPATIRMRMRGDQDENRPHGVGGRA